MDCAKNDELKAKFTAFIEKVVIHAKIDFIRMNSKGEEVLYLEELREEPVVEFETLYEAMTAKKAFTFQFEEERLAQAFSELPLMRQRILELLFVGRLEPCEVAELLHCSIKYVYDQKYKAIKQLRMTLKER